MVIDTNKASAETLAFRYYIDLVCAHGVKSPVERGKLLTPIITKG